MIKQTFRVLYKAGLFQARQARFLSYIPRCSITFDSKQGKQFDLSQKLSKEDTKTKAAYEDDREDQFSIMKMQDIKSLMQLYQDPSAKFKTNEFIKILARAEQLLHKDKEFKMGKSKEMENFREIIDHIKFDLQEGRTDFPMIGSLAYALKRFQISDDKELWLLIAKHIFSHQMIKSKNELLRCCQGATEFRKFLSEMELQEIGKILEEEILNQNDEYDLHDKSRILKALFTIGASPEKLMKTWQKSIFEEIGKEHSLECVTSITEFYVTANMEITREFLNTFERKMIELLKEPNLELKGKALASCIAILNYGHLRHADYQFQKDLFSQLSKLLTSGKVKFEFRDYLKMIESPELIAMFSPNFEIDQLFKSMKSKDPEAIDLEYMSKFAERLQSELEKEPQKDVKGQFENVIVEKSRSAKHQLFHKAVSALFKADELKKFPQVLQVLPAIIAANIQDIDFEELCYLYMIIEKNKEAFDWKDKKFNYYVKVIRDSIKRQVADGDRYVAAHVKGDSNYYKLLEVVDPHIFSQ